MKAVISAVPEPWLEERARLGIDRLDELWNGVLHMAPPPGYAHQKLGSDLLVVLKTWLAGLGLDVLYETAVLRPGAGGRDYRVPDLVVVRQDDPGLVTERGLEGAPLVVVELRSPHDETDAKLPFWAALGVPAVVLIEPRTRSFEVLSLARGSYVPVPPGADAGVAVANLDLTLTTLPGDPPRLRLRRGAEARDL